MRVIWGRRVSGAVEIHALYKFHTVGTFCCFCGGINASSIHLSNWQISACWSFAVFAQEPIELVSSTAGIQSSRPALSSALLTADAKYDKFLQPSNKTFGSVCGKIFDGPWSGFSGPLSPNSNFNVDDLFGSPNNNDSEKKSLIKSTIDGTSAASQRERSIFNFASAKQSKHPDFSFENSFPAPQQPAITHAPLEDNTINLKASSGHYTPTCTSNAGSFASISFGFSNTKPAKTSPNKTFSHPGQRQTKQTGDGPTDYNPLLMRGPGASIFKGTCKWYNSQRGFGFIIPVRTFSFVVFSVTFFRFCCL